MRAVPDPDLRPLRQPLSRSQLRAARPHRRRGSADLGAIGLRLAGGLLLGTGSLLLLVAATAGGDDPAMPVVSLVLALVGAALLVVAGRSRRRGRGTTS